MSLKDLFFTTCYDLFDACVFMIIGGAFATAFHEWKEGITK